MISSLHNAKSPVAGEAWPALKKDYKKLKTEEGNPPIANMELHGDMLDSLTYKETKDGIELGFFDEQAWKADGHLKFSGKEGTAPQRRFLPGEGEEFISSIQKEVEKIITDAIAEDTDLKKSDFEGTTSSAVLYENLRPYFPDMVKSEIRAAVMRNPSMTAFLDDLGLLEFL